MEGRILTCVYCGHEYPQDTPASSDKILTDHIKICEKHPMREAEQKIKLLRAALIGLIGAGKNDELEKMELILRSTPGIEQDKITAINAIHAIIQTN